MRSFHYGDAYPRLLTPEIVGYLTRIHERKGRQNLFISAHQDALSELLESAKEQSTEASNRMAGVITADDRFKKIARNKTTPRNRNEREIAGYRDALTTIHESYGFIPLKTGSILQLHRDLFKFGSASMGGAFRTGGSAPEAIEAICTAFHDGLAKADMDPLVLIPRFILDFLCIHPFDEGNGRMSRLLTQLLLCQSGYLVGKYISLEKLMADTKESYEQALKNSSARRPEGKNDDLPFVRYMLGTVNAAYQAFSDRAETLIVRRLSKPERVRTVIRNAAGRITKAEIMRQCPDISQKTVERALTELMDSRQIIKISGGRYTSYAWNGEGENA